MCLGEPRRDGAKTRDVGLERVARVHRDHRAERSGEHDVAGEPRFGVPIAGVGKFIAIGLNYADHAAEAKLPLPSEPVVFQKAITSLSGPNDDVVLPKGSKKSDWEVELGSVIGTRASYVERDDALAHVAG